MFQPKTRYICYLIRKPTGESVHLPVRLDEAGLALGPAGGSAIRTVSVAHQDNVSAPAGQCRDCEVQHGHCRAWSALTPVIDAFGDMESTDEVDAEVTIEGRVVSLKAPVPRVLASVMGLLMASSGCPRLAPFQAMALFHQPFATAEENVVRAAGFWLMAGWARGETLSGDSLTRLQVAWDSLEEVNHYIARKILARSTSDAASNGIAFLDALAKIGTIGLESAIEMLRPALLPSAPPA